jgi:hypothetical protein
MSLSPRLFFSPSRFAATACGRSLRHNATRRSAFNRFDLDHAVFRIDLEDRRLEKTGDLRPRSRPSAGEKMHIRSNFQSRRDGGRRAPDESRIFAVAAASRFGRIYG